MKKYIILLVFCALLAGCSRRASPGDQGAVMGAGWRLLPPIPDPVGFGGMFAGVIDEKLVTGGGSQFPGKPLWLGGGKSYGDGIYSLSAPDGRWRVEEIKLPEKAGHFASAAANGAIYMAGGITAEGFQRTCLMLHSVGGRLGLTRLPDLPVALGYAAAAVVDNHLVVAGGRLSSDDNSASRRAWALSLGSPDSSWMALPDCPGEGLFVPAAAARGHVFYLFGGMAFDSKGTPRPSKAAWCFDFSTGAWERLPDLPEARVGACTPCPALADGRVLLIGGYAEVFPGPPREHPGFAAQTLVFDPASRRWDNGPLLPRSVPANRDVSTDHAPNPMLAAPCAQWLGLAVCVGGEVRSGVRTPVVMGLPLEGRPR
ncbi:MAG: hypothetical protein LBM92_04350 [Opitutaceae bacterium]|jgi:N-acetylneuraminic acid mutarotase|nr:hypothetical protein [Opitutaceae bacterium]